MHTLIKIYKSFFFGWRGLCHAFRDDKSFRLEILLGLPTYAVLGYILAPLLPLEWLVFIGSYMMILIVELINTSIEKLLDRLHPEKHELIEHSKDIVSGAVLLSFVFALATVLVLFFGA